MFGLTKYLDKIYQIKWYFEPTCLNDMEGLLFCKFTRDEDNDYYTLQSIHYTYVDILFGMEELNFTFSKNNDDYIIRVLTS